MTGKYNICFSFRGMLLTGLILLFCCVLSYSLGGYADYEQLGQLTQKYSISLSVRYLPIYALMSLLRIMMAMFISFWLSIAIGRFLAYDSWAKNTFLPLIDILQSIPTTGFLNLTAYFFICSTPRSIFGAQCAVIFALITCQIWNMILDVYHILTTMPLGYRQVVYIHKLSPTYVFWRIELPMLAPKLIWSSMLSISASWFMIVAAESLSFTFKGKHLSFQLPGIGGYIQKANDCGSHFSIVMAMLSILLCIFVCGQMIFNPLLYYFGRESSLQKPWFVTFLQLTGISKVFKLISPELASGLDFLGKIVKVLANKYFWSCLICLVLLVFGAINIIPIVQRLISLSILDLILRCMATALRIMCALLICTLLATPLGIFIGMNSTACKYLKPVIQLISSFPINVFYGALAGFIMRHHLPTQLCCIIIMVLSSLWYLVFNLIAGITAISPNQWKTINALKLSFWLKVRKILVPALLPYYGFGLLACSGAAWNAIVLCEYMSWHQIPLVTYGLGAYIATHGGQALETSISIGLMSLVIFSINKFIWIPLLSFICNKYSFDSTGI